MMFFAATVALSLLGSLVNAQSANDTALGIVAIEAHFTNAKLVPDLLSTFAPEAVMNVTFSGVGAITPGQNLTTERESLFYLFFFLPRGKKKKKKMADALE
jgi:phosphatidylethanolamine-binding protein